jgi:membrane fusion protein (multidrug efflux system)
MTVDPDTLPIARRRRVPLLLILAVGVGLAGIAWAAWYWWVARHYEFTDDAYVAANIVTITPLVAGTVKAVAVRETQHVEAGNALVLLDEADTRIALLAAEADLGRAVREVSALYENNDTLDADIAAAEANLLRTRAEVEKATDDLATRRGLIATGAVGREELRHAEAALRAAIAARSAATATIASARERLGANRALTEGTSVAEHPNVLRAAAAVREAHLALARTRILAPVRGDIAKRVVQVGQRVSPGMPLMSVVPLDKVWVDANFKEGQLGRMRIGQPAKVTADLYGTEVEYAGRVAGLGAGTGAAFALLPAQNATGNWIKIVQRVPVRIELDPATLAANPLRVGLSMQVEVDVRDSSGPVLAKGTEAHASTTDIFEGQDTAADERIAEIIAANLAAAPGAR